MNELLKSPTAPAAGAAPKRSDNSTEVVILGGRFTVKSAYSAAFVDKTAALVNEKLSEIIRDGGVISTDKVAILACMNLASELLKLQEEHQTLKERTKRRLEKVLAVLDTCLSQEEISYVTQKSSPGTAQNAAQETEKRELVTEQ